MASGKGIFDRFGLNAREQRLAQILAIVLGVFFVLGLPIGLESYVASKRSDNDALRDALDQVQASRLTMREHQQKRDAIDARYARKAPELAGYLEQMARKQKLEVTDSVDRPPLPIGKQYTERSTVIHLRKAGMLAISKFMEAIEQSGSPIAVTRLDIRKRTGEPDSYDVELGVTAYDRVEKTTKSGKGGGAAGHSAGGSP